HALALLDRIAVLDPDACAVRDLVGFAVLAVDLDGDDQVAAHRDQVAADARDRGPAAHLRDTVIRGLEEGLLGHLRGAADGEGTHGELSARLADRLGGDDAHGLADVHPRAARQVAAVAGAAGPDLALAGQHRADLHGLHARLLDLLHGRLVEIAVGRHDD